jgi:hypothetical protein
MARITSPTGELVFFLLLTACTAGRTLSHLDFESLPLALQTHSSPGSTKPPSGPPVGTKQPAGLGSAQEQKTLTLKKRADHTVYLLYDDSELTDSARAKLISLLASQPSANRKILTVTEQDQGITKLIQNNYHLSGITDQQSVGALASIIRSVNGLASDRIVVGQALEAPSVPTRAYRIDHRDQPAFRVAPFGSEDIAIANGIADLREDNKLTVASEPRQGDLTAKELSDPHVLADLAWKLGSTPLLPAGVLPIEDGGDVKIWLASSAPCDPQQWLDRSPLYSQLKSSLSLFLRQPGNRDLLHSRAADLPLIVIDWNDSTAKHGQKVTSVVSSILNQLDVNNISVTEVDLNPTANSSQLKAIFSDYLNNYYCALQGIDCKSKGQKALIADVNRWLNSKPQATAGIATLKQLLLEAVLWKFFATQKTVVNMSFSIDSLALEILQAQFLAASRSVGVAAASDNSQPEGTAGIPQRAASVYPNFLNVTYGNTDGTVLGGFSSDTFNILVTTMAQGCGFRYGDIAPTDAGTSFAAPYVATAIWLRALMTGSDLSTVRRDIVEASDVSQNPNLPQIESSGPFDLASFLLPSAFAVVNSNGSSDPITQGELSMLSTKSTGGTIQETFSSGEHITIAFVHVGSALKARIRRFRSGGTPIPIAEVEERLVSDVVLDARLLNGTNIHKDKDDVYSSIVELRF